jgi:ABC-type transport system involved in cytochrome bd biosynthesis fused ATPase/permease subunit
LLDGKRLTGNELSHWRRHTAWVDPSVRLFNRRFAENLLYGSEGGVADLAVAIDQVDLREVLERLPEGMQTMLGEGGALVSGGEGQRVRIGRAWLRRDVRLVLLDEPFRGLSRDTRALLLDRARQHWAGATMICVTHDVSSTLSFPRVLVVEAGRIVEDGDPRALAADGASRYHALLAAEQFVQDSLWGSVNWRRFRVENGRVSEQAPRGGSTRSTAELASSSPLSLGPARD